jgi:hypothetical protein
VRRPSAQPSKDFRSYALENLDPGRARKVPEVEAPESEVLETILLMLSTLNRPKSD